VKFCLPHLRKKCLPDSGKNSLPPTYRVHIFHLTVVEEPAELFAKYIQENSQSDSVLFIGYSGGANIAYETALVLKNTSVNVKVKSIIMIDGFKWETGLDFVTLTEENIDKMLDAFLKDSHIDKLLLESPKVKSMLQRERSHFLHEAEIYQNYCESHKNRIEKIDESHIYNILSNDVFDDPQKDTRRSWNKISDINISYVKGKGTHLSMLSDHECLRENRKIIFDILSVVESNNQIILEAKGLIKTFGANDAVVTALNSVDFQLFKGEFVVILGASGSGKSTLLNVLSTLEEPNSGEIKFYGETINYRNKKQILKVRKNHIGFVFQSYHLIPNLSVEDNIKAGQYLADKKTTYLDIVDKIGVAEKLKKYPYQLSGGEQQRVAIARALAKNTDILFCDEPTGALDTKTGILVLTLLQEIQQSNGISIVLVTHNNQISDIANRVVYMRDGEILDIEEKIPRKVDAVEWL
jgi:putative ABC transport system ATP-binding protein